MTALIVVFITLSLMGSALWIMPSKREREKMALRMLARKHNMTVQLTSVELPDKWDKVTEKVSVCAYHRYREKPLKDFADIKLYPYEVWKHDALCDGWYISRDCDLDAECKDILSKYKDVFVAVEATTNSVTLHWHEKGGEQAVEDASRLLTLLLNAR